MNRKWAYVILIWHLCINSVICLIDPITIGTVAAVGMQIMTSFYRRNKKTSANCFFFLFDRRHRLLAFWRRWQRIHHENVQQIFRIVWLERDTIWCGRIEAWSGEKFIRPTHRQYNIIGGTEESQEEFLQVTEAAGDEFPRYAWHRQKFRCRSNR